MAKILVVDDDPDIVESMRLVLESKGHEVDTAGSKEEAAERTLAFRPQLVLLDVMMPEGTEGFHFVWELRNRMAEDVRNTPIIILTAIHGTTSLRFYPDETDGTYAPGEYLPVQGFIDKPAEPAALLAKVDEVLAEAGQGG